MFNCSISANANPIALCWGIAPVEDGLPNCGEVLFLVNDSSNLNTVSWPATNAIFQAERIQCGVGNVLCSSLIPVFHDDTEYLNYTISCISDELDTIVIRFLQSCDGKYLCVLIPLSHSSHTYLCSIYSYYSNNITTIIVYLCQMIL